MRDSYIYIVGDKFKNFSTLDGAYTFSDFVNTVHENHDNRFFDYVLLGQGLNQLEKKIVTMLTKKNNLGQIYDEQLDIASLEVTHKKNSNNVMISAPIELKKQQEYISQLYLNDDAAEMSDHITGYHIQGIVLIEAARQMMLAVAETYLLDERLKNNSYCALFRVSSEFFQFGFPIETQLVHKITELSNTQTGRYKVKTTTDFLQNSNLIASIEIDYLFNNHEVMLEKELSMAKKALESSFMEKNRQNSLALIA